MTDLAADEWKRWWRFQQNPDFIAREIVGPLAIADLVAVQFDKTALVGRKDAGIRPTSDLLALRTILACRRASRSVSELADLLGVSHSAIRRATRLGQEHGSLLEHKAGRCIYRTSPAWKSPVRRMVAAELKRSDWRRAIHQAWAYQAWAHASWLILGQRPPQSAINKLCKSGIGLAYLNDNEKMNVVFRPTSKRRIAGVSSVWAAEQSLASALAAGADLPETPYTKPRQTESSVGSARLLSPAIAFH